MMKPKKKRSRRRQHLLNIRKDKRSDLRNTTSVGHEKDVNTSRKRNAPMEASERSVLGTNLTFPSASRNALTLTEDMEDKGLDELQAHQLKGEIPHGLKIAREWALEKRSKTEAIIKKFQQKEQQLQDNNPQHFMTVDMLGQGMEMSMMNKTVTKIDKCFDPRAVGIKSPCGSFAVWGNPHWKQSVRRWALQVKALKGHMSVGFLVMPYSPVLCDGYDLTSPAWILNSDGIVWRVGFAGRETLNHRRSFRIPVQKDLTLEEEAVVLLSHTPQSSSLTMTVYKRGGRKGSFTLQDIPPLVRPFVNLQEVGDSFTILSEAKARNTVRSIANKKPKRPVVADKSQVGWKQRKEEEEERLLEELRREEQGSYEDSEHMVKVDKDLHHDSLFEEEDGTNRAPGFDDA